MAKEMGSFAEIINCVFCHKNITSVCKWQHVCLDFGIKCYQCGLKNCRAEFQTEFQMKLHYEMKHNRTKVSNTFYATDVHVFLIT